MTTTLESRVEALEQQRLLGGIGQPSGQEEIVSAINRQNAIISKILSDEVIGKVLKGPIRVGNTSILDGAVTAEKISVETLSAMSVDAGDITAGTLTGVTIRTAISGARVELSGEANGGLIGYGASDTYDPITGSGTYQVLWKKSDGKLYFGAGLGILTSQGIEFKHGAETGTILWNNAASIASLNGYSSAIESSLVLKATYDSNNFARFGAYNSGISDDASVSGLLSRSGNTLNLSPIGKVKKNIPETVNNSTTLQDDDELKFYMPGGTEFQFEALILYDSGTTPDIKFGWSVPVGCTMEYILWNPDAGTSFVHGDETSVITQSGLGAGTVVCVYMRGMGSNPSNSGFVTLQWAQATANASDTKVLQRSYIILPGVF